MNPDDQQASCHRARWYPLLAIVLAMSVLQMVIPVGAAPSAISEQRPALLVVMLLFLAVAVAAVWRRAEPGVRLLGGFALAPLVAAGFEPTNLGVPLFIFFTTGVAATFFVASACAALEDLSRRAVVEVIGTLLVAGVGGCGLAAIIYEPIHIGVAAMLVVLLAVVLGNVCDRLRGVRAAGAGSGIWPLVLGFGLGLHLAVGSPLDAIDVNDWAGVVGLAAVGEAQSSTTIVLLSAVIGVLIGAVIALLAASRRGVLALAVVVALSLACALPWLVAAPSDCWPPLAIAVLTGALTLGVLCALLLSGALELGLVPVALITGWSVGATSGSQAPLTLFAGSVYAVAGVLALAGHRRAKRHGKADAPSA